MGSKMYVSDLIRELPDMIWHLLDRKVSVLDGRSEDFKNYPYEDAHHNVGKHKRIYVYTNNRTDRVSKLEYTYIRATQLIGFHQ